MYSPAQHLHEGVADKWQTSCVAQIFNGEDRGSTYVSRAKQRKGVPQYGQLHGLLGKGAQAIESLLPGWKAVASQLGAISYQPGLLRTVSHSGVACSALVAHLAVASWLENWWLTENCMRHACTSLL